MALTTGGVPLTPEEIGALRTALGIPDTPVTTRYTSLMGTDDAIFLRGGAPGLASATVVASFAGSGGSVPVTLSHNGVGQYPATGDVATATFAAGWSGSVQWLRDGVEIAGATSAAYTLVGDDAGTDLSARVSSLIYTATGLAVSAPPPPAGITYVGAGTEYAEYGALTTHPVAVPAGLQVGDFLVIAIADVGDVTAVATNEGQSLPALITNVTTAAIHGVVISGTVPTSINVTTSPAGELRAQALAYRGPTQTAGTNDQDVVGEERANIQYNTDAANAAVITVYAGSRSVTAAVFNGADAADLLEKFEFNNWGVIAGIHDGPTGSNNIALTWTDPPDGGGRYFNVALKA